MDFCFILSSLLLLVLAIVFLVLMTITVGKFILEQLKEKKNEKTINNCNRSNDVVWSVCL